MKRNIFELGYNVMQGTKYFVPLKTNVDLPEEYNVILNSVVPRILDSLDEVSQNTMSVELGLLLCFSFVKDVVNKTSVKLTKRNLMFCGPRTVIYLCRKSQQDAMFYCKFISIINLYIFRAGLLLIIRRLRLFWLPAAATRQHENMTHTNCCI